MSDTHPNAGSVFSTVAAYLEAYEKGDKQTIQNLIAFGDAPKDARDYITELMCFRSGDHRVLDYSVGKFQGDPQPLEWEGEQIAPTGNIEWTLVVNTVGNLGYQGQESTATLKMAFGKNAGQWRICLAGHKATTEGD